MPDLFSTNTLVGLVEINKPAPQWLLDTHFTEEQTETSEEIHFDVYDRTRRLAPFVHPDVPGRIVESNGYRTETFSPAYIKDKRRWRPNRALKRVKGEQLTGNLSPAQRMLMLVQEDIADAEEMRRRRMEVMASEVLRLGQLTVTGDDYPTKVINFNRDAAHTETLAGAARWGEAGVGPLADLNTRARTVQQKSGMWPSRVTFHPDAWDLFVADPEVEKRLDWRRVIQGGINLDTVTVEGAQYQGSIGGFDFYTYAGWYENDAGTEVEIMPQYQVLMTAPGLGGYEAYGAIQDERAGIQAMPVFVKSWIEEDPPARMIMSQSAPIVVPKFPNSTYALIVR